MKKIFLLLTILYNAVGFSQSKPDYEKLSKVCELWGMIKYFHPDQPGNKFDSAFAAQVPKMLGATDEKEWGIAINDWLSVLNDRNTRVVGGEPEDHEGEMKSEFTKDSVLVVSITGSKIFNDWSIIRNFATDVIDQAKKSKGVIFDLRQQGRRTEHEGYLTYIFDFSGLNEYFSTSHVPQSKTMYYSGFKPERGSTSGGYTVNKIQREYISPGMYSSKNPRVVWIVNEDSELPFVALSQQEAGAGLILSSIGGIDQLFPLSSTFKFSDSINVKYKTEELAQSTRSTLKADAVYSSSENALDKAKLLISGIKNDKAKAPVDVAKNPVSAQGTPAYPAGTYPSVGYRVLAAAKIYTVIQNFFPYHQFMDKNWKQVLGESLPEFISAKDDVAYGLAVAKMYANIQDSHGFISENKGQDKLYGQAPSPMHVDYIENKVVVIGLRNDSICKIKGIAIGDVILRVNGVSTEKLMEQIRKHYSHSTPPAINELAAQLCIRGNEGEEGTFAIEDAKGKVRDVKLRWAESNNKNPRDVYKLDVIQLINPNIGYADLTRMNADQTDEMFEKFKNTKAIIFDMRGYPKGTAWSIAPRLTEKKNVPLALFRKPEVMRPDVPSGDLVSSKSYTEFIQTVAWSDKWKYKGKTVMLINQHAISQSEHTGLFFESVNNTTFIGSPTAGANGDVTNFSIPGGMWLSFSGQGVWHADGRQLQRLGLQPHIPVKPTIKGIREGKDEVFDKGVEWITRNVQ